ncbi:hypothetical protein BGW36DRAFT_303564 [Talaromyces proteolyticus]|uniref:MADS-box domain-containing protein n=1 Tax=Talaromyces proteolyticus TaxID=1131652 RepID=A0AAD4KN79_9EURO|nr:uncharacterized protein BGW36DRAFT_303564 [Talaromyces proteolyticus]KAH8691895.1 hypothetical protein BGW36DRAFT_303564 [Talaromyces proteolyticus]
MTAETSQPLCPNIHVQRRQQRQRRDQRQSTLFRKAYEMSEYCNADVFLGVRIRDTGRITTFCADGAGIWSPFISCLNSYYPTPNHKTSENYITNSPQREQTKAPQDS